MAIVATIIFPLPSLSPFESNFFFQEFIECETHNWNKEKHFTLKRDRNKTLSAHPTKLIKTHAMKWKESFVWWFHVFSICNYINLVKSNNNNKNECEILQVYRLLVAMPMRIEHDLWRFGFLLICRLTDMK